MKKRSMEHKFDYDTMKSGHGGYDVLRETARRTFAPEMRGLDMRVPESASAVDRRRMRPYKNGGHVHNGRVHKSFGGDFWKGFKMPFEAIGNFLGFAEGGHVHRLNPGQSDLHFPRHAKTYRRNQPLMEEVEHKKRGGKMGRIRKDAGGSTMLGTMTDPNRDRGYGQPAAQIPTINVKRGGKVARKANGGSIYEREMLGERPSRRAPRINYEADMRGERPVRKTSAARPATFKKGGRVKKGFGGDLGRALLGATPGLIGSLGSFAGNAIGNYSKNKSGMMGELGRNLAPALGQGLGDFAGNTLNTVGKSKGWFKKGGHAKAPIIHRKTKADGGMSRYSNGGMNRYENGGMSPAAMRQAESLRGRQKRGFGGKLLGGLAQTFLPILGNLLPFEEGGRVCHRTRKADGGMSRYAVGGVGKVRHKAANKRGEQMSTPSRRVPRGGGC